MLFRRISYNKNRQPYLSAGHTSLSLLGFTGTLSFDTSQRYCIGWHDITTGQSYDCPENASTINGYDTCPACQRRTGFNPAFYHATKISSQQEIRNNKPHLLYLASMGPRYNKVGISLAERGLHRLLEQGARAVLPLDTLPTALIARHYEAAIAALPDIHETTRTKTKLQLLRCPTDEKTMDKELLTAKEMIEVAIETKFIDATPIRLNRYYYKEAPPTTFTTQTNPIISGTCTACIGDIVFMYHKNRYVALPLKQYTGYNLTIQHTVESIDLPAQQVSLFE